MQNFLDTFETLLRSLISVHAPIFRSSHQRCSIIKGVLRNFAKFTGKYLCQNLFFVSTLLKKRLWHRYFPVNIKKFLRLPLLQNNSGRLLLNVPFLYTEGFWRTY